MSKNVHLNMTTKVSEEKFKNNYHLEVGKSLCHEVQQL